MVNIYFPDEYEKKLYNIKFYENFDSSKSLNRRRLGKQISILAKSEYTDLLNSLEINSIDLLTKEKIIEHNYEITMNLNGIELMLLETKFEFIITTEYRKKDVYDYANEKLYVWKEIFYSSPMDFSSNHNIQEYFSQEILEQFDEKLNLMISQGKIKSKENYTKPKYEGCDKNLSKLYNDYIHLRYIKYIDELKLSNI